MIKLEEKETPEGIWAGDMKDGDVAVIISWSDSFDYNTYPGRIVQRYGTQLITIGMGWGQGWSRGFYRQCGFSEACRVRLLEKGEKLVVA